MYGKAVITLNDGLARTFNANDEDAIAEFLYDICGDTMEELVDIPTYIEASSWCPMASIGDVFERDLFIIEITE